MSTRRDVSHEYLKNAVMTASQEQLHLMLLDGAIRFATQGRAGLEAGDMEAMFNGLDRAQKIVLELSSGLRRDVNPPLANRMAALYDFIFRRLVDANMKRDVPAVDDALRILRHQRETWVLLMDKLQTGRLTSKPTLRHSPDTPADSDTGGFVAEG